MARHHRQSVFGGRVLVWTCSWCCILLLRHNAGRVVAQSSLGDDDSVTDSDDDASANSDCDISSSGMIGDALCDFDLNVAACGFDGGDCCECTCIDTDEQACGEGGAGYFCLDPDASQYCGPTGSPAPSSSSSSSETSDIPSSDTSSTHPGCGGYLAHMGDGFCDEDLNNAACGFDGGDCCACTCGDGTSTDTDDLKHSCGEEGDGYDCRDPNVPDDCGVTPSPASSYGYPDCTGYMYDWQDSYCDYDLNNEECGWDGGDCCPCTCRQYSSWEFSTTCGYYGYDCMDPDAPSTCSTDSPTPSPAAGTDYPECEGTIYNIGNGICESYNNNEACDWDGGDCCRCTCQDTSYYTCGYYGYDCMDPEATTTCSTDSPTPIPAAATDYPDCEGTTIAIDNNYCDYENNNEECDWDGGDCCSCTCEDSGLYSSCGSDYGYNCLDPNFGAECLPAATSNPTPSPSPDCTGYAGYIGDGECDKANNNEECGWDGGDCCPCTCDDSNSWYTCGDGGYDCLDPTVSTDCGTTTQDNYGYGDYDTSTYTHCQSSGDGKCDSLDNTEACYWDGGDCCECDCVSVLYSCGLYGYNCLDPASTCASSSAFRDDDAGVYGDDFADRDFGDSSTAAIPVDQQEAWAGDTSESSFSNIEIAGVLALSAWGFFMLGWCLWAACRVTRRSYLENEKEGATQGKTARSHSVKARDRRSRLSGDLLAASVAAALAIPPDDTEGPPPTDKADVHRPGAARQSSRLRVHPSAEESKAAEKVEVDAAFYGSGADRGEDGEVKREDPGESDADGDPGDGGYREVSASDDASDSGGEEGDGGAAKGGDVAANAHTAPDADAAGSPAVVADAHSPGATNDVPGDDDSSARDDVAASGDAAGAIDEEVVTSASDARAEDGGVGATGDEDESAGAGVEEISSSTTQPTEGVAVGAKE